MERGVGDGPDRAEVEQMVRAMAKRAVKEQLETAFEKRLVHLVDERVRQVVNESRLNDALVFGDASRISIAPSAKVKNVLFNTISGSITIQDAAFVAHSVALLTGTHDPHVHGLERHRAIPTEGRDIVIERGAWVATNATVVGPVRDRRARRRGRGCRRDPRRGRTRSSRGTRPGLSGRLV